MIDQPSERRRRLLRRAGPAAAVAAVALGTGVVVGSLVGSKAERTAERFGALWQRGDYAGMHRLLTPDAARRYEPAALRAAYEAAAATATATAVAVDEPAGEDDGRVRLPVELRTRVFGRVRGDVLVPVVEERVAWTPELVFPGLGEGERLSRRSVAPRRASLLAADGRTIAEGPAGARESPLGATSSIAGELGEPESARARRALYARGFPADQPVGLNGLERVFERELAGRPGGALRVGRTTVARARPQPGATVRTTIDPGTQASADAALGGRFGGIAALDARSGAIRALAGVAFSAPQPPGSTFKIVTTAAALEAGLVKLSTSFPVETRATIDGVPLENAGGESCGGTFRNSFAHSCNSVFAPLGVKLGAKRLVAAAERFGFNRRPTIPGAEPSTLPAATDMSGALDVGSTAIGQGRMLATPLMLASIAQAVAAGGVLSEPRLRAGAPPRRRRVMPRGVARTLRGLMVDVVAYGTGTAAAIGGVRVAGKTGTAELEDTRGPDAAEAGNTDAWFAAFAPAERPRLAVAVMFVRAGAGGAIAAPAAKVVLEPAVRRG